MSNRVCSALLLVIATGTLVSMIPQLVNANSVPSQDFIEGLNLLVVFDGYGNAIVKQNFTYVFGSEVARKLVVPVSSFKLIHPYAPFSLLLPFAQKEESLLMKNFSVSILGDGYSEQKGYPEGFWQKVVFSLPQKVRRVTINLNYTLVDAIVRYPLFSSYEVILEVPGNVVVRNLCLTLVVENLTIPEPWFYFHSSILTAGSYVWFYPQHEDLLKDTIILEWHLYNVTARYYPLYATFATSPIPGLGLFDYDGVFLVVSLFIAILLLEIILSGVRHRAEENREEKRHFLFKIRPPIRMHPLLILITALSYYTYSIPFDAVAGRFGGIVSWAFIPLTLEIAYFFVNFFLWPFLVISNNAIRRRKPTSKVITSEKLVLWTKSYSPLVLVIFLYMFATSNFVYSLGSAKLWAGYHLFVFRKELWYLLFSIVFLAVTSFVFFKQLEKLSSLEEKVNNQFQNLLGQLKRADVTKDELNRKCEQQGISPTHINLAIESLSKVERSLRIENNKLINVARMPRYVFHIEDPEGTVKFVGDRVRRMQKSAAFAKKYGYRLTITSDPYGVIRRTLREKTR